MINSKRLIGWVSEPLKYTEYSEAVISEQNLETTIEVTCWKGDRGFAKIDLLSCENLDAVKLSSEGFSNDIQITLHHIKDIYAHDIQKQIPDILYTQQPIGMQANRIYSVWVDIEVAPTAADGVHNGKICISAGNDIVTIDVQVDVLNILLPENTTYLELWQYPYTSNRYYSKGTVSDPKPDTMPEIYGTHLDDTYDQQLLSQIELYKKAGGSAVTVTVTEDPWNWQTPDPYPSMVKWVKNKNGSFSFDYTDFDKWVAMNEKCGVSGPILSFSIVNWGNNFTYFDEESGNVITQSYPIGSEDWCNIWTIFLTDYMKHTMETGVFHRVYIAMDERRYEQVKEALDVIESVRNDKGEAFRVSLAVYTFDCEELFDRIHSLSFTHYIDMNKMMDIIQSRNEQGLITTLYTCGDKGSSLVNQPYQGLDTMWYIARCNATGFLRWALDAFNAQPLETSYHRLFASGDINLIYPGDVGSDSVCTRSSVRYEMIAAGCRDITKIKFIKNKYPAHAKDVQDILDSISVASERDARYKNIIAARKAFDLLTSKLIGK